MDADAMKPMDAEAMKRGEESVNRPGVCRILSQWDFGTSCGENGHEGTWS